MTILNMSRWPRALPIPAHCYIISIHQTHAALTSIHPANVCCCCMNHYNIININRVIIQYVYCTCYNRRYYTRIIDMHDLYSTNLEDIYLNVKFISHILLSYNNSLNRFRILSLSVLTVDQICVATNIYLKLSWCCCNIDPWLSNDYIRHQITFNKMINCPH